MIVTVLDTKTGERRESRGWTTWSWAYGNISCDCNRALMFGEDVADELGEPGICFGSKRFLAVEARVETPDDYQCSLGELNIDYPVELLEKHGITK